MKIKAIIFGAATLLVGLPLAMIVAAIVTISVLDQTNGSLDSSGQSREYLLHVPGSYDPTRPTPLIISLHGGATWPAQQMNLSQWNQLSDEDGFIVVYPSGTPQLLDVVRIWHTFEVDARLDRDVRYIADLIDTLAAAYNIDPARIYANGLSNGGGMAFVLSCALSDRIAAVGLVAPAQSLPSDWCRANRPVPMIAFHGTSDPIVPYEGGPLGDPFNPVKPVFPAQRTFVASWAERNRCAADPVESTIAPDVTRLEYTGCAENAAVVLNTVIGGGHTWPGGKSLPRWYLGSTSNSIDATRQMWTFFRAHPLQMNLTTARL